MSMLWLLLAALSSAQATQIAVAGAPEAEAAVKTAFHESTAQLGHLLKDLATQAPKNPAGAATVTTEKAWRGWATKLGTTCGLLRGALDACVAASARLVQAYNQRNLQLTMAKSTAEAKAAAARAQAKQKEVAAKVVRQRISVVEAQIRVKAQQVAHHSEAVRRLEDKLRRRRKCKWYTACINVVVNHVTGKVRAAKNARNDAQRVLGEARGRLAASKTELGQREAELASAQKASASAEATRSRLASETTALRERMVNGARLSADAKAARVLVGEMLERGKTMEAALKALVLSLEALLGPLRDLSARLGAAALPAVDAARLAAIDANLKAFAKALPDYPLVLQA